ncbi:MAG: hypothetical protein D6791_18770 [Chloroflexi bacterium]|nr:MAG: hypothetical protein D6791_18770 [Chloroflexota bacterium]
MIRVVVSLIAAAVVAGVAVAGGGVYLETRDSFCAACHTQPETMYYERSIDAEKGGIDLAAFHHLKADTRCIDCHGGVGLQDRLETLVVAAGDTVQFATGRYMQPARMTQPLSNPNCRQCHDETVRREGFENHFHNLMDDPEAPDIFCVACHVSHQEGDERAFFIREIDVFPSCNRCHGVMGGPSDLR